MSEEAAVEQQPVSSVRHWKPADDVFTNDEKANIALALGMPVEAVRWEVVEDDVVGDVIGHSLVGSSA